MKDETKKRAEMMTQPGTPPRAYRTKCQKHKNTLPEMTLNMYNRISITEKSKGKDLAC